MIFGTNRSLSHALALVLALPAFAATLAAQSAVTPYTIDPVHSAAKFEIEHLLVSTVSGQFDKVEGTVNLDPNAPAKSSVDVVIDAASINTIGIGHDARDKHLKSPDFFDVAKFPTITFKSSAVTEAAKGQYNVTGTLTMHGVSNTIVIPISQKGPAPGMQPGTLVAGFKGSVKLKRSDYGIKTMIGPIGDETTIALTIEADAPETK
jgi:polyisoprenoid-binding protein YceI